MLCRMDLLIAVVTIDKRVLALIVHTAVDGAGVVVIAATRTAVNDRLVHAAAVRVAIVGCAPGHTTGRTLTGELNIGY